MNMNTHEKCKEREPKGVDALKRSPDYKPKEDSYRYRCCCCPSNNVSVVRDVSVCKQCALLARGHHPKPIGGSSWTSTTPKHGVTKKLE